jgi:hypothetical protein
MQFARTDPRKHSFAIRTVEPWNKLPESIKNTKSGGAFKNRLKKASGMKKQIAATDRLSITMKMSKEQ